MRKQKTKIKMIMDKNNKEIKKFEPEPESDKPVVKKSNFKRKLVKWLIVLLAICSVSLYALYEVDKFFDRNTFIWVMPVELHLPLKIEAREENKPTANIELVPTAQAAEVPAPKAEPEPVKQVNHAISEVVRRVYQLESSGGKNDGCRAKGLYNGYGYAQSTHTWNCFTSHEEVTAKVTAWFEKRIPTMGLSTALCYYQSGYKTADCGYYQKYLKLK